MFKETNAHFVYFTFHVNLASIHEIIHDRNEDERKESGEGEAVNDGPREGTKEGNVIATKEDFWFAVGY